jgi:hypothetical protein
MEVENIDRKRGSLYDEKRSEALMNCERIDFPVHSGSADYPEVYALIATRDLLTVYKAGPMRLGGVLAGLSDEDLKARPHKDKWSIQEIAMHLTDAEVMGATRMRQTLAEPGTSFAIYNQEAWASELDYQSRDRTALQDAVHLFNALRTANSYLLERASHGDWQKWGCHSDWGKLTLRQLLEIYADHSERHIEQILELRKSLGKPLQVPLLLPNRLY